MDRTASDPILAARARLLAERRRLERRVEALRARGLNRPEIGATGELSSYDNHPADQGTETFEREKDLGLHLDARVALDRVDAALARLEEGTYGRCRRCGRPIEGERMRAAPWADLCAACARAGGGSVDAGGGRPVEEEVLAPPFGRSDRDGSGIPGVDGEDVWESVERFGSSITPQDAVGARDYGDLASQDDDAGVAQAVEGVVGADGEPLPPRGEGV